MKGVPRDRVGDFGFVLASPVSCTSRTLDYSDAFAAAPKMTEATFHLTNVVGAGHYARLHRALCRGHGQSAQFPLHVWRRFDGSPRPLGADPRGHMVTAGFHVARMSPLFEQSGRRALGWSLRHHGVFHGVSVCEQRHQKRVMRIPRFTAGLT